MGRLLTAFLAGALFGTGLLVSEMTNPSKVIAFLNVFGNWDPSLAVVLASALLTTFVGYRLVFRRQRPLFNEEFSLPTRSDLDIRLIIGAALFGIGWGLSGLCPGPAFSLSAFGGEQVLYFLGGLVGSVAAFQFLNIRRG